MNYSYVIAHFQALQDPLTTPWSKSDLLTNCIQFSAGISKISIQAIFSLCLLIFNRQKWKKNYE